MDACHTCSRFFHINAVHPRVFKPHKRVLSLDEQRRIGESARRCRLCRLILIEIQKHEGFQGCNQDANHILDDDDEQLTIRTWSDVCAFKADERRISFFKWELLSNGMRTHLGSNCHVWADQLVPDDGSDPQREGSPSFDGFVDWPPDIHHSPAEIASVTQRLLNNCLKHHTTCGLSIPQNQEALKLPSRVISLQNDGGVLSAKLLETNGLKGTYCALSHCWGSKDRQPLTTTRENIRHHLESIPWSRLPSTFRDAIHLVSALGLKYLWIDSLCIIQDDSKDWAHEAMRMASVYRNALLVIAAANSKDSTEGLVGPQLPPPLTFRCPITIHSGSGHTIYQATIISTSLGYTSIEGPLRERAWAFQEWYLGRRKVFFTKEGIMWKCNEAQMSARGERRDLGLYETSSWINCLEIYSEKKLTIQSDRIIALLGIVAELQEDRDDSFRTEFGVWEDDLVGQLLWKHMEAPCNDFPSLPSWCWAATGGSKVWATERYQEPISTAVVNRSSQSVTFTQSGSLNASGLLIRVRTPSLYFEECCLDGFRDYEIPEGRSLPFFCSPEDLETFPIHHVGDTRSVLGFGVFDSSVRPSECFCFALTFEKRQEEDPAYDISEYEGFESGEELPTRAGNLESEFDKGGSEGSEGSEVSEGIEGSECDDSDVQSTNGRNSAYLQEDEHVCLDFTKVKMYSGAYWSLLLQPVDDTLTKFRRIGIALMWPRGLKEIESEVQAFEIV